jgi:hypothetical protein
MVHLLKGRQRSAELCRHDLGVFGHIARLVGVRMGGFEDKDVSPINDSATLPSKRGERSLLSELSPVSLAKSEREMALVAARKVTSHLGLPEWSQRAPTVVLGSVSCAVASRYAGLCAAVESAGALPAIERPEGT